VIALDTNVLVRILVDDDADQCRRARALAQRAVEANTPLFVSDVVMCETVWVLSSCCRTPRADVPAVLSRLAQAGHLAFEDGARIARAADSFARGRGDFADYLIRERSTAAGCSHVATCDQDLLREGSGFALP